MGLEVRCESEACLWHRGGGCAAGCVEVDRDGICLTHEDAGEAMELGAADEARARAEDGRPGPVDSHGGWF